MPGRRRSSDASRRSTETGGHEPDAPPSLAAEPDAAASGTSGSDGSGPGFWLSVLGLSVLGAGLGLSFLGCSFGRRFGRRFWAVGSGPVGSGLGASVSQSSEPDGSTLGGASALGVC